MMHPQLLDALHREVRRDGQRAGLPPPVAVVVAERPVHEAVGVGGVEAERSHLDNQGGLQARQGWERGYRLLLKPPLLQV